MANAIIILVNKALEKVREIPITPEEFDSRVESHHMTCRRAVEDVLRDMYLVQKDEKLKSEFTLSTVASQAEYSLGFDSSLLADTNLRVITADATDYWLNYLSETEALDKYIDFNNLTQTGRPSEWWFRTGSTPNDIKVRFNLIPDAIYTVKGFKYVAYSDVTALSVTPFTALGDAVIVDYIAAMLANQYFDDINTSEYLRKYNATWSKYLLENQKTDETPIISLPYQANNEHSHGIYGNDYFN